MKLRNGIVVDAVGEIDLTERIQVCDGVVSKLPYDIYNKEEIYEGVFFPNFNFIDPCKEEWDILTCPLVEKGYKEKVTLFSLSDEIKQKFELIDFSKCVNKKDILNVAVSKADEIKELQQLLVEIIEEFELEEIESQISIQGFHISKPGLPTVAVDRHQRFIGLHIDYSAEAHKLNHSNTVNRLCINIGRQPREFVFVNLTVSALIKMVNEKIAYDFREGFESLDLPSLVQQFFTLYPHYPIGKIIVNPYEGYIAPTDNFIHEGSTKNMTEYDITLSFLGHFTS